MTTIHMRMNVVTHTEGHTLHNFVQGQFFGSASSSGFTMNHRTICFFALRGLRNDDNSRVSALQIVLRSSQGVQKEPMFIFKISQILNISHNNWKTLELPHFKFLHFVSSF